MNKVEEIQANLFSECKSILESLAKVETKEALIAQKEMLHLLMEKVSHIEFLENNKVWFDTTQTKNDETKAVSILNEPPKAIDVFLEPSFESQASSGENEESNTFVEEDFENEVVEEEDIQEEPITQVSWETEQGEEIALEDESKPIDENPSEDAYENGEESVCLGGLESSISEKIEDSEEENEVLFSDEDFSEGDDLSLSFENEDIISSESLDELIPKEEEFVEEPSVTIEENISVTEEIQTEEKHLVSQEEQHHEKKIKLPHIKGLKTVQTLFDDEILAAQPATPSVADVSQDIKPSKTPFKLDLNDRIAFSKMLFGGSQMELNEVVNQLNHFDTLDEAKEFLSDMYYEKDWEKVDEYAQRLWILVENKFM